MKGLLILTALLILEHIYLIINWVVTVRLREPETGMFLSFVIACIKNYEMLAIIQIISFEVIQY